MNAQALWYLEGLDLFGKLCPLKSKKSESVNKPVEYKAGEVIYIPDQKANELHMIVEGRVKIGKYLPDGKEATLAILGEGEVFGEMVLAGQEKRENFAEALDKKTLICSLELDELKTLMLDDKDMSIRIMRWMGLRIQKLERKVELLAFRDARSRIVEFLKDSAAWKGKVIGHEILIKTKLTHNDIAKLTATSRQTVSEILNTLRSENQIHFERGRILIRDLENLS